MNVPGFVGGDRTSLDLPAPEEEVLKAVKATGKPLALVLMNGSALSVNWAAANADAILEAWYPGQAGGTAIGETLSGATTRPGRLPVTFYTGVDQLPPFKDYAMKGRTYRYFHRQAAVPVRPRAELHQLRLWQAGAVDGDGEGRRDARRRCRRCAIAARSPATRWYSSPQLPQAPGMPVRALRGFSRVNLAPGASGKVISTSTRATFPA